MSVMARFWGRLSNRPNSDDKQFSNFNSEVQCAIKNKDGGKMEELLSTHLLEINEPSDRIRVSVKSEKTIEPGQLQLNQGLEKGPDGVLNQMALYIADTVQRVVLLRYTATSAFHEFVWLLLRRMKLSITTVILGLTYIVRRMKLPSTPLICRPSQLDLPRLLTVGLMLGNKHLDAKYFSSSSWSEFSGIPISEINALEQEWLSSMESLVNLEETLEFKELQQSWKNWQGKTKIQFSDQDTGPAKKPGSSIGPLGDHSLGSASSIERQYPNPPVGPGVGQERGDNLLTTASQALSPTSSTRPSIGFAFDIDGVIHCSGDLLPRAAETIEYLQEQQIPFIFLTNGGGKTEQKHAHQLGLKLRLSLQGMSFVQSHTPWLDLVPKYRDKNVLVLGGVGNDIRNVALEYGFQHPITAADIVSTYVDVYPFHDLTIDKHIEHGQTLPEHSKEKPLRIDAIFVWTSPRDWGVDAQLIIDLLLSSKGQLGTLSPLNGRRDLPNNGYCQDETPALHWCNPDLTFASSYLLPRAAQGSFQAAVNGIWSARTNGAKILNQHTIGKPTQATYEYGEKMLENINKIFNGPDTRPLNRVYMIGDNQASDIRGANSFQSPNGTTWKSILVETGVYRAGTEVAYNPTQFKRGVGEAVDWALADSRWETWTDVEL